MIAHGCENAQLLLLNSNRLVGGFLQFHKWSNKYTYQNQRNNKNAHKGGLCLKNKDGGGGDGARCEGGGGEKSKFDKRKVMKSVCV